MTKTLGEVWFWMLIKCAREDLIESMEDGIRSEAIKEWGFGTKCFFDRSNRAIEVIRAGKSKSLNWDQSKLGA